MKAVIQTVTFQLICVLVFGYIYWLYIDDFVPASISSNKNSKKTGNLIDCFYTSITVQSGVGYNGLDPITNRAKLILMTQQFIMICANVLILYLFSTHLLSNKYHHHKK
jgi:hypothetical protein